MQHPRSSFSLALLGSIALATSLTSCAKQSVRKSGGVMSLTEPRIERIQASPATPDECSNGGTRFDIYLDTNGNGVLDSYETVISGHVVCSGTNGRDGENGNDGSSPAPIVFGIMDEAPGCPNGGKTILFGIDSNRNGVLDSEDTGIQSTEICNGEDGEDGQDGEDGSSPEPTPSTTPTPSPTDTPDGPSYCKTEFYSSSSWGTGYILDITVTYFGPSRKGWTSNFVLPGSQSIVNAWNIDLASTSGAVAGSSLVHNEDIHAGSKVSFGFQVSRNDADMLDPETFRFNGAACE
jgi:hypothetical protein